MNLSIFAICYFILIILLTFLADKLLHYYLKRKAEKLYKILDCQVYNLDINNNKKGD